MMLCRPSILLLTIACVAPAQNGFYLNDGDRVVFYGDSITDQRLYTTFTETYVVTRFPKMRTSFTHSGWGGDRVTGGGGGPVDLRLQRDVIAYKPTVMTIMLGMNDGSYKPFDARLFGTFSKGYEHIVQTVRSALPAIRVTAIIPSPYDDVTRPPKFDGGYNAVLVRYGAFLTELAARDKLSTADLNAPVVEALRKANAADPETAQKILPDRVHPGAAGHLVMAEALLKAWWAPALVTTVEIDAATGKVSSHMNTEVSDFKSGPTLSWTQMDRALPMPLDLKDPTVALVLRSSDFVDALDRETLKIANLTDARYALKIDGMDAGAFGKEELERGVNLAMLPTPMMKQAAAVHALTLKRSTIHNVRWRMVQVPLQDEKFGSTAAAIAALDAVDADLTAEQRALAQPVSHQYELVAQ